MKILVTGGSGFIGSNFIELALNKADNIEIINIDKETYAGIGKNIEHMGLDNNSRYTFFKTDICDKKSIADIFEKEKPNIVINFAAESHVDRSIENPLEFIKTNINGTANLLESSRKNNIELFVQISTDEVYGSLTNDSPQSLEKDLLDPRSPYSASKSSAEHLAISYFHTFNLPVIVTRSSNNYGPYQFPEKLLPLFATNLIDKEKVTLMHSDENPGLNIRDWLYVEDNCESIYQLIRKGIPGEIYNIAGDNEKTNVDITNLILKEFNVGKEMIKYIPHRKGHDFRYAINDNKLNLLGINENKSDFNEKLKSTIDWYRANENWWRPLKK